MYRVMLAAAAAVLAFSNLEVAAQSGAAPQYVVEPFWPKPLPDNWILGQVAGVAVDNDDSVWIVHRPATLVDDEKGAAKNPPETRCCKAAGVGRARATTGPAPSTASTSTRKATSGLPATVRTTTKS